MPRIFSARTLAAASAAADLLALAPASHAQSPSPFTASVFTTGATVSGIGPDSITLGGDHVFVEYGNGANSAAPLGTAGASTIAECDLSGKVINSFSVLGSADGVRYNPYTNQLWVLQNQDGNSALITINPTSGTETHYSYTSPSPTRGFDDAAFVGGKTYLSYTNPANPTDPIIEAATLGGGAVNLSPVLADNATGLNTATGKPGTIIANDPDSLIKTPNGGLLLTSGDDGSLTTVNNPGAPGQSVNFVSLTDSATGMNVKGLDDTVFAASGDQRLLVADTANNTVYSVQGPFQSGDVFSSIGSTHSLDSVNLTTGVATAISGGLFAANASPHGLAFVPAPVPETSTVVSFGLLLTLGLGGLVVASRKRKQA